MKAFGSAENSYAVGSKSVVVGPGLGTEDFGNKVVFGILDYYEKPENLILDADALNFAVWRLSKVREKSEAIILTPNLKEMKFLEEKLGFEDFEGSLDTTEEVEFLKSISSQPDIGKLSLDDKVA